MAKEQPQYYTILFDKYIELMTDTDRYYYMVADKLKELILEHNIDNWENTPIPDFMETVVILSSLRELLDKKINDPPEEEIKFCNENNIKDVLVTKFELTLLQKFSLSIEEQKQLLLQEYGFKYELN
jgi:hypothetical protein